MSFVVDHVRKIDGQLDHLYFSKAPSAPLSPVLSSTSAGTRYEPAAHVEDANIPRILQLQSAIQSLSTTILSGTLLHFKALQSILEQAQLERPSSERLDQGDSVFQRENDLEWLLVSKAAAQAYGLILNTLLEQTIPLSSDIWYWDEVLGSYVNTGLYSVQTSPWRFWRWGVEIYEESWRRLQNTIVSNEDVGEGQMSLSSRWRQFYGLVKDTVRDRSFADLQTRAVSPLTEYRDEVRKSRSKLKRFREMSACGLGVLMNEGLSFDIDDQGSLTSKIRSEDERDEWKTVVSKSVALMESILQNVTELELGSSEFEYTVFTTVENDPEISRHSSEDGQAMSSSASLAARLQNILQTHVPEQEAASQALIAKYGRPSRVVRYWLPATALFLSSSTLLRIFVNRRAEITAWVRDLGTTTIDFWYNWVVEPAKKVIATIRHDKDSEIAIMSKESLEGDRASLERMVVDFTKDTPTASNGVAPNESELAAIRTKVREGDLTPVLRAYENDLRKPFVGTVRGNLVRALLIQIQKTKVDVEVAMSGIDALLKSQELVFGFVGLTPGILVCLGMSRWLGGLVRGRQAGLTGRKQNQKGQMIRVLRNIDRILTAATPSNNGMLSYKEHGLLLCEVHVLRQRAQRVLPGEVHAEFLEEVGELVDITTGVDRQLRVVDRIRWAYGKWLR